MLERPHVLKEAQGWFEKACDLGEAQSCFNVATFHEAGLTVRRNPEEARVFLEQLYLPHESVREIVFDGYLREIEELAPPRGES